MKRLTAAAYGDKPRKVIATFRLRGDRVEVEENTEGAIESFGLDSIPDPHVDRVGPDDEGDDDAPDGAGDEDDAAPSGMLTPSDGKRYYDALDRAFRSGSLRVDTVPDDSK